MEKDRLALVIGIDDYPYVDAKPLRGCVNDARRMKGLLRERFGFEVRLLLDEEATQETILQALEDLRHQAHSQSRIVVHFSGHGSRIGDDLSCSMETLVPHDSGRGSYPNRDVNDQQIYRWLSELTAVTPLVTLIIDSCHSGGIVRELENVTRGIAPDLRPEANPDTGDLLKEGATRGLSKFGPSGWLPLSERYTLIAACRAEEYARELQDSATGCSFGALTYFLTEELKHSSSKVDWTYRELFERVQQRLSSRFRAQNPQLEGAWDRQLFGSEMAVPVRFVPILQRAGDQVRLGAGAAHGVVPGSEWEIVPAGSRNREDALCIGRLRVRQAGAVVSKAELLDELSPGAAVAGCRAIEVARPAGVRRLGVRLAASTASLAGAIEGSAHLRLSQPGEAWDLAVHRLPSRARVSPEDPVPQLGALKVPTWTVTDGSGCQVMPPVAVFEAEPADRLVDNLELRARHRALAELTSPDNSLASLIEVELLRRLPGGGWQQARRSEQEHLPIFFEADALGLRLRHRFEAPLHVAVLDLGLTGAVTLLYPPRGAIRPLAPLLEHKIGMEEHEEIRLSVPGELPYPGETTFPETELVVVIATTEPADLGVLAQPGVRHLLAGVGGEEGILPAAGAPSSPLSRLLRLSINGLPERDAVPTMSLSSPHKWAILKRSFLMRSLPDPSSLSEAVVVQ